MTHSAAKQSQQPQDEAQAILLLVNDNADQLELLAHMLASDAYSIISADSAESAFKLIRSVRPDVIVSDVVMPQISGIEFCRKLKAEVATACIPVLLVSSLRYDDEAVEEGLEAGALDYFEMSVFPGLLTKRVNWLIAESRERRFRLEAEEKLRHSEQQYRLLFEQNPQPIWVYDTETLSFLAVNDAAAQHYGYTKDEFLRMRITDILASEDAQQRLELNNSHRMTQFFPVHLRRHSKKDGLVIDVEITSHSLVFEGHPARLVLATDVSERRRLEEELRQSQKMEAIGELAGGVAHDFNNLLTVIIGFAQLLANDLEKTDPRTRAVDEILLASNSASSLIKQLLAFSRKQLMHFSVLNLNTVIERLDRILQRIIGEDIDLATVLSPDLSSVRADSGQIEQVIMNLVVNARDAMPRGGKLVIETANADFEEDDARERIQPGSFVMLAISDTGAGINKETQARMFEPFFTTKEMGRGTGLGLSTVYGIVKQMGGFIRVSSEAGAGTGFKVYLPRTEASAEPAEATTLNSIGPSGDESILVVEDNEHVRKLTVMVLRSLGYTISEARSGDEAIGAFGNHSGPVQLLISDVVMPGMSGPELAASLCKKDPDLKVLFMSGYTDNPVVQQGVLGSEIEFIQKPFTTVELAKRVREILDQDRRRG